MDHTNRESFLVELGADPASLEPLVDYLSSPLGANDLSADSPANLATPMDEAHVSDWGEYEARKSELPAADVLRQIFVQLNFPVREGMSSAPGYVAATRRGESLAFNSDASPLEISDPDGLDFRVIGSASGRVPVVTIRDRNDFENLIRALLKKNEPVEIPKSMGATIIAGYINWARVQKALNRPEFNSLGDLKTHKELFQDTFIVVSQGPYSGVRSDAFGLSADEWAAQSLEIRTHHEAAHYFTRRAFGKMRINLLDELIADYAGLKRGIGHFRADWFLHFMGLEAWPKYRAGGRFENYLGELASDAAAVSCLQSIVVRAANNLEAADKQFNDQNPDPMTDAQLAQTITQLYSTDLDQLAASPFEIKVD